MCQKCCEGQASYAGVWWHQSETSCLHVSSSECVTKICFNAKWPFYSHCFKSSVNQWTNPGTQVWNQSSTKGGSGVIVKSNDPTKIRNKNVKNIFFHLYLCKLLFSFETSVSKIISTSPHKVETTGICTAHSTENSHFSNSTVMCLCSNNVLVNPQTALTTACLPD